MAREVFDEFGQRWVFDEQGRKHIAPEAGVLAHTGRFFADATDNIGMFLADSEAERNEYRADLAERERLFKGAEIAEPVQSFVGGALPGLATAPLSAGGFIGGTALNAGIGALEGALGYDENASAGQRAIAGALGGVAGDWVGRMAGRVWNGARGLLEDIRFDRARMSGEDIPGVDPDILEFEALGGKVPGFQYLDSKTPQGRMAERAAMYSEASVNPDPFLREVTDHNDALYNQVASEAAGLDWGGQPLTSAWRRAVLDSHEQRFSDIATRAANAEGFIEVDGALARVLKKNKVIKELHESYEAFPGLFEGDASRISPDEWVSARKAIAGQAAAEESAELAGRHWGLVNQLDEFMEGKLPDDPAFLDDYAELREQHKVFLNLEKPNVIDKRGHINVESLDRQLKRPSGFGRTATAPGGTYNNANNPATSHLIDLADAGNRTGFKAFKSSGTAENLAGRTAVEGAADAAIAAGSGDFRPAISQAIQYHAPGAIGRANRGRGAAFEGAYTPAAPPLRKAGGAVGRSMLDEMFYPFVGVDDDRPQ